MKVQQQSNEFKELKEKFSEWSEMGYSFEYYLFEIIKAEQNKNEYLKKALDGTRNG